LRSGPPKSAEEREQTSRSRRRNELIVLVLVLECSLRESSEPSLYPHADSPIAKLLHLVSGTKILRRSRTRTRTNLRYWRRKSAEEREQTSRSRGHNDPD